MTIKLKFKGMALLLVYVIVYIFYVFMSGLQTDNTSDHPLVLRGTAGALILFALSNVHTWADLFYWANYFRALGFH